ncbi:hypothetical protein BKA65DRAFT_481631 [Rhexocercosporidium sp. MPI-PUGE-AT-0058]|nr:hypothetical protein BKA65DRAFT_481631 [Rhexocercosporidium sp. MPI-PUGE-AT-0058]
MAGCHDRVLSPGHYRRIFHNGRSENRTALLDNFEVAANQSKEQRAPLIQHPNSVLDMRNQLISRGRRPPPHLDHFPQFSKLPLELREMVWIRALPCEQIIEVGSSLTYIGHSADFRSSHGQIANTAHTCKEAYDVVVKRYQKKLSIPFLDFKFLGVTAMRYVDHPSEILYMRKLITNIYTLTLQHEEIFRRITRIALPIQGSSEIWEKHNIVPKVLRFCENLKEIIFVADEERFMAGMLSGEKDFLDVDYVAKDQSVNLLPRERKDLWEEVDHPYLSLYKQEIKHLQKILKVEEIVEAFRGVEISFELWRRPSRSV